MIGAVNNYSNALMLLNASKKTQETETSATDNIISIVNSATKAAEEATKAPKAETKAADATETDVDPAKESRVFGTTIKYWMSGNVRSADNNGTGANFFVLSDRVYDETNKSDWYAENFGSEDVIVRDDSRWAAGSFASKAVVATTLNTAEEKAWQEEVTNARDTILNVVDVVLAMNHKFHVLEQVDLTKSGDNLMHDLHLNNRIQGENSEALNDIEYASRGFSARIPGLIPDGYSTKVTGNDAQGFKLEAFQIKDKEGRMLAEMRDDDHLVTYNKDGSVQDDFNRADVGYLNSKLGVNKIREDYLSLAANMYSEAELDFY